MLNLSNGGLHWVTTLAPLNGASHEPWSPWLIRTIWAGAQEPPFPLGEVGPRNHTGTFAPASAHSQGELFLFIFTSCLGLALSDSSPAKCQSGSSPQGSSWIKPRTHFGLAWFGEKKDMFLHHHIFLSNWLLGRCMALYKLHKALTPAVPTALQHGLREQMIFIVKLSTVLLDEWSSSLQ